MAKDKVKDKEKEEEKESNESIDETYKIPKQTMDILRGVLFYPEDVIAYFHKDAILVYASKNDPDKNWDRFIGHYFKNEKPKIEEFMRNKTNEKSWIEIFKERNPDYRED